MAINIISQTNGLTSKDTYLLTRSPSCIKLSTIKDTTISVSAYVLYEDEKVTSAGEVKTAKILSLKTADGKIYATNSNTFIDEFMYIVSLFGLDSPIRIIGGISRQGRNFLTCSIE